MFLDDDLVAAGRLFDGKTQASAIECVQLMVTLVRDSILKGCSGNDSDIKVFIANTKRAKNQWNIAVNKLKKEGIDLVKQDAFDTLIVEMTNNKEILKFI